MYKLITSSKDSDDLSMGFDSSRNRRKDKLTNNKNIKGKHHLRIMLRDVSCFAECQEEAFYGVGYKLTLIRNKDEVITDKTPDIANARIEIDHIQWYVPHYTRSI